jgi:hypothetical protein
MKKRNAARPRPDDLEPMVLILEEIFRCCKDMEVVGVMREVAIVKADNHHYHEMTQEDVELNVAETPLYLAEEAFEEWSRRIL